MAALRALSMMLLPLLALTACSADDPTATEGPASAAAPGPMTGPPGSAASATSSASATVPGLEVAVRQADGGVQLYRVDRRTRAATRERALDAPTAAARALDIALASDGTTCISWHTGPGEPFQDLTSELVCYAAGSSAGTRISGVHRADQIALSDDGNRLAWSALTPDGGNQVVSAGALSGGQVTAVQQRLAREQQPATGAAAFTGSVVQDLGWLDDRRLLLSTAVESDDHPELRKVDLQKASDGWLASETVPVVDRRYYAYDTVASADGSSALAVQRGYQLDEVQPPEQAVRIDVRTGRVLAVLATADDGRYVAAVSGDADDVVYATADSGDDEGVVRAYLRRAGEARGTLISGLPADTTSVITAG